MRYTNPILYGDYSDPDVIRVGGDFYMVSSSFTYLPGIPVLRSRDLVHWALIGYAARRLPFARYDRPAHGCGTWAPSIRYHKGLFYVYVCLPDEGLLAFTAADPAGEWTCHVVKEVWGWIDPCPLFAADGKAWLVHGLAASRCGVNNLLFVHELSPDGLRVLDKGRLVYDGAAHGDVTVEGPKFYRRGRIYWILCPAGGVKAGYQLALQSPNILGPYRRQVVLAQGSTAVNGPHQGGWVTDGQGGDWFIHFQDVGVYGRVPHLQPVDWRSGWPVMGREGEPVPGGDTGLPAEQAAIPASDDFARGPGLQWQWQANPNPAWFKSLFPGVRLFAAPADSLHDAGQFLSQLMQARDFDFETAFRPALQPGDRAGIAMMGKTCHELALCGDLIALIREEMTDGTCGGRPFVSEERLAETPWRGGPLRLKMSVREGAVRFFFAGEGEPWQAIGGECALSCGGWTSARPGIFCLHAGPSSIGFADFAYVWIKQTASKSF